MPHDKKPKPKRKKVAIMFDDKTRRYRFSLLMFIPYSLSFYYYVKMVQVSGSVNDLQNNVFITTNLLHYYETIITTKCFTQILVQTVF